MKKILVSLMLIAVVVGVLGTASTAGMSFNNVGALSLGIKDVPTVNVDYLGFHLSSAYTYPVTVDKVYISLDQDISAPNAVSVSVRASDGSELAYYAANDVTWVAGTTYLVDLYADGAPLPSAAAVYKVKVVVATNSHYN